MKAVKLIAIAVAVLAIIVGLLLLTGNNTGTVDPGVKNQTMLNLKSQILAEWNQADNWDAALLDKHLDKIEQNKNALSNGYQTLIDLTAEVACHRLDSITMSEFAKPDCNHALINAYHQNVTHLVAKVPSYENNEQIKKLKATIALYNKARNLIGRTFACNPQFDFTTDQWKTFANYRSSILQERNNIRQSTYYQNIQNINEITTGLSKVENRIETAKETYKTNLSNQIIAAYSPSDPALKDRLQAVYGRYKQELGTNQALKSFVENY